jgi:hypothetical protein
MNDSNPEQGIILHNQNKVCGAVLRKQQKVVRSLVSSYHVKQKQMSAVASGNKDVDSARLRFASLHKVAHDAQQKLKEEEKRQRERVEWLQKQIELFQLKGMSPAQLSFRNYLKDVKRLPMVHNHIERTPHPLRCFISYAWETNTSANKELQDCKG